MDIEKKAPEISDNYKPFVWFGYSVVFLIFGVLGTWICFAKLDSAVIAVGEISIDADRKTIQHYEGGIIAQIHVRESQIVNKGDLLLRLKPVQADANQQALLSQMDAALALEAKLVAERNKSDKIIFPIALYKRAKKSLETRRFIEDQQTQFKQSRDLLKLEQNILGSRTNQLKEQILGLQAVESALDKQIKNQSREYRKVKKLAKRGYYPRNRLFTIERELIRQKGSLGQTRADISKNRKLISETKLQIVQLDKKYREQIIQKLGEVRNSIPELRERLRVAGDIVSRIDVRAPLSGTVHNLRVHTLGGVIRGGEALLDIVPLNPVLQVNAHVNPLDINYVYSGQKAEVQFPGFKDRTALAIIGEVKTVSADRHYDENTREYYYLAIIEVQEDAMPKELWSKLTPGMPTNFMIATGENTVFDYLFKSIIAPMKKAMHEPA